ncbi:MAG: transposase [Pseudomonadota bacterium]|nr:transposase [Pseudomonadota bacterium]
MPRQSRFVLANCPHHIIQRGHNRQLVFADDEDYLYYIENLQEWKTQLKCKIYAYCLMSNHVHLVADPGENVENLAQFMKRVGGRQTRYFNKKENRSGSLWEGRYKSSPIQSNRYLLACCRYVELNPVRAGMVEFPWEYMWSSCGVKVGERKHEWLDLDPFYQSLGETEENRETAYKDWLIESISDEEMQLIREAAQRGQLTGDANFIDEVVVKTGRRIEFRGRGRPHRDKK